jgi:hypothetical protein
MDPQTARAGEGLVARGADVSFLRLGLRRMSVRRRERVGAEGAEGGRGRGMVGEGGAVMMGPKGQRGGVVHPRGIGFKGRGRGGGDEVMVALQRQRCKRKRGI